MSCPSAEAEVSVFIAEAIRERLDNGDLTVGTPSLVDDIAHALVNGAEGMLLWVSFQIHELCLQHCDENIRKAIGNLPKGLTETFNRALDGIITQGKGI
ncbi:uncharacterized protein DNG_07868 [Cephalotrichum gorgonifer]|uniref:Uncharacterized protein n=1 Tax=Cephalotrichum gorgonifer TaxID=2041049 RepID=A0AAE8N385_9PEZI|nr:uncharacterized protein DNG_07868 [Cephalotrichum gorgonifer]